jgi:hypothetical protein
MIMRIEIIGYRVISAKARPALVLGPKLALSLDAKKGIIIARGIHINEKRIHVLNTSPFRQ